MSTTGLDSNEDILRTIIKGASPNDPRFSGPVKLEVTNENGKLKRSSFACVGCHSLKQKCWPSDLYDIYRKPCQRCLRQKKVCTFDLSKRTRKRKCRNTNNKFESVTGDESSPKSGIKSNTPLSPTTLTTQQISSTDIYQSNNDEPNIMFKGESNNKTNNTVEANGNETLNLINNISNQQNTVQTTLPGIKSLSGFWPEPVNNGYLVPQTAQIGTINQPNRPTNDLRIEDEDINRKKKKKNLNNQSEIHLNHAFKKQLQSLLLNQKEKAHDLAFKFTTWSEKWNNVVQTTMFLPSIKDPIAVGILSTNEAYLRLNLYKHEISVLGKLSFIKIPPAITVDQLRSEKPILFSVIMSIVSIIMKEEETSRDTIMKLDSFVLNLLTNQIYKVNNKSIEVIEAHIVLCTWYNFLEWSSKTRYHLFNYISCCLTKDLGPMFVNRLFAMFSEDAPQKDESQFKSPLELYTNGPRIILLVYITSLNISIFLRQTIQLKWGDVVELALNKIQEQIDRHKANPSKVYANGTYSVEDDIVLVAFTKMNHMLEKIHVYLHEMTDLFDLDDPEIKDRYIQKLLIKYRAELQTFYEEIPKDRKRLQTFYHSVEAYFHQYEVQYYLRKLSEMKKRGIASEQEYESIRSNAVRSFIECYNCCISTLQEFSQLSPPLIASIPLFLMSRLVYTVGMLLLRLRYSVVAFPIFHHLLELTDNCVIIVNDVREMLSKSSQQYPYNYFLYKFQYVFTLFVQTYANKVIDLFEAATGLAKQSISSGSSLLDESIQLNPMVLFNRSHDGTWIKTQLQNHRNKIGAKNMPSVTDNSNGNNNNSNDMNNSTNFMNASVDDANSLLSLSMLNNQNSNSNPNIGMNNNNDILRTTSNLSFTGTSKNVGSELKTSSPSVSITSDNLNDYLTDVNSLAWGYNALNDEFWTDLFIDDN